MSIKKVWVEEGCIACGLCGETAPEVFEVDETSVVMENAKFEGNEDAIKESAENCPVEVIKFEE